MLYYVCSAAVKALISAGRDFGGGPASVVDALLAAAVSGLAFGKAFGCGCDSQLRGAECGSLPSTGREAFGAMAACRRERRRTGADAWKTGSAASEAR